MANLPDPISATWCPQALATTASPPDLSPTEREPAVSVRVASMDPLRLLIDDRGFFTRAEARTLGYDDRDVAHAVRSRSWFRIRRGYFTFVSVWEALDDVGRHWARARAVAHSLGDRVVLSHVSGAIAHGLDVWGADLSRVHVTRVDDGPGRIEGDVVHHEGRSVEDDVVEFGGVRVFVADRCAIEAASRLPNEPALALCDALLRQGDVTHDDLMRRFEMMEHWPHTRHLHVVVRMARGESMSVGESRGRHLFWRFGIPAPILQYEVRDASGRLIGVTDWAWPEHEQLGEFDGKLKYGRLLRPGQEPGDAVFEEKVREDALREATGYRMIRIIWADYDTPAATAERVRASLRRSS